jgi:CheY-like chemotaxis protein/HPt (histidine-containing phosphotransfer) domain-containing protein
VVDDHPVTRLVMTAQLAALGYAADAADSGETALAALAGQPYDAVLLDCEMPELDGYETCRRLRRLEEGNRHLRRTPVIALTAHTGAADRERCLAAGMDGHLGKPWGNEELAALLQRWLEKEADPAADPDPVAEAGIAEAGLAEAGLAEADMIEERLEALRRLGEKTGQEELGPVIESFLSEGAKDLQAIRQSLSRGDGAALAAAAHSLAGSAGILGAAGLATGCAELEELARREDLLSCEPRLASIDQSYQEIARRLSPYRV